MASKVNTKFVIIAGIATVCVVGGVAAIGLKMRSAGGDQNIARAEDAMKAGDLKRAIQEYGRAVNKDRGNAEWIRKWLGAIEKSTPASRQAYNDAYRDEYLVALRALCEADRANIEPFRRYLEERYQSIVRGGASLAQWENLEREYKDLVDNNKFRGDDKNKNILRRYRGLARSGMLTYNTELSAETVKGALEDLNAALAADPADADALMGKTSILRANADRAARAGRDADAAKFKAEARTSLDDFLKAHPDSQRIRFAVLSENISDTIQAKRLDGTLADVLAANRDGIAAVVNAVKNAPPDKTDPIVALAITQLASAALPEGRTVVREMLDHVQKGHEQDPMFLLGAARLAMQAPDFDRCTTLAKTVVALPDKPMSLEGALMFYYRMQAVRTQVDAAFLQWELEKDPAKKAEKVAIVRALRTDLASRIGESDSSVLSIDGRLDYMTGDYAGARTRVSAYNDQTQRSDPTMLALEADLLVRLGQKGAAKTIYERILTMDRQNIRVLRIVGMIEFEMRDYKAAFQHFASAAALLPDNAELAELRENARMLATEDFGKDPVLKCLADAIKKSSGLTGDQPAAIKILSDCLDAHPGDIRLSMQLANHLYATKDIDGAKAVLDKCIAANPTNLSVKDLRARMDKDPLATVLAGIDASPVNDILKSLARWNVYTRAGKPDEAKAALAQAVKLDPDMREVIDAQFEDALIRRDQPTLDAISARAQTLNLDKVGGLLYKARAVAMSGKSADAIAILEEVTKKDRLNLLGWRLLGIAYYDTRRPIPAADALQHALDIKPDDIISIDAFILAKMAADQPSEALEFARKKEEIASSDSQFVEMLLTLEANAPGGDKAKAIAARTSIAERVPGNRPNRTKLAALLVTTGNLDKAKEIITKLREEDADDPIGVQLQASLMARNKDTPGAIKLMQDYIAGLPKEKRTDEIYINAGRLLQQIHADADAKKVLEDGRAFQDPKKMLIDRELGDMLFGQGQWADANVAYQRVVDAGGDDEDTTTQNRFAVRKRILEGLLKLKDYNGLIKAAGKLPASAQGDATVLLLQAEAAVGLNDTALATKLYGQAVASDPKNPIPYIKRGDWEMSDPTRLKDAEADFDQAVRVDPSDTIARIRLVGLYRQSGRDELALAKLREVISISPGNEQFHLALANMCTELGRLRDAAEACDVAVARFGSIPWRMKAGQSWSRVPEWNRTVDYFISVWKERKGPEIAVALIEALLNNNDERQAYIVLQSPDIDVSKNLALRMLRARVLAKQGLTAQAADEINKSLPTIDQESYEQCSLFMSGIAGIYPKLADQLAALARLETGRTFTGYLGLKVNELRARDPALKTSAEAALEALANTAKEDRVKAACWSLLGTYSYVAGNWEQARVRFKKGIDLDPDNIELNNNLAYVMANKLDKGEQALPFAEKAAKGAPQNSGFLDTLGTCQMAVKDYAKAAVTLRNALNCALNDTERTPVFIHLGWLRLKQGDKIEARRLAGQARDLMTRTPAIRESYLADLTQLDNAIDGK